MSKLIGAATVCECGNAVWRMQKSTKRHSCALFPKQCSHYFEYMCNECDKMLPLTDETKVFCPTNANLLQWATYFPNLQMELKFASTHLFCFRCEAEDRNIGYDWLSARKNLWLPKWRGMNYYGITTREKAGAGPWMQNFMFCANCANKEDLEDWLKNILGLVLLKKGHASPHKISELADEMKKNFPHIPLKPAPWG